MLIIASDDSHTAAKVSHSYSMRLDEWIAHVVKEREKKTISS